MFALCFFDSKTCYCVVYGILWGLCFSCSSLQVWAGSHSFSSFRRACIVYRDPYCEGGRRQFAKWVSSFVQGFSWDDENHDDGYSQESIVFLFFMLNNYCDDDHRHHCDTITNAYFLKRWCLVKVLGKINVLTDKYLRRSAVWRMLLQEWDDCSSYGSSRRKYIVVGRKTCFLHWNPSCEGRRRQ